VQQHADEIRRLGAEVLVVAQARPELLTAFVRDQPLPFPILSDPQRDAYRAFGLEQTSWWTFLRPGVMFGYLRLMFRGVQPQKPTEGEDVLQLGGDFVLDGQGRLVYAYRSAEPTDRPTVAALLQALRQALSV
jgi:AhpC/TSA antioxidant enzyme